MNELEFIFGLFLQRKQKEKRKKKQQQQKTQTRVMTKNKKITSTTVKKLTCNLGQISSLFYYSQQG